MKKLILLFFLLVLYFAPFVVGRDLQIVDRFRHLEEQSPLFIVYREAPTSFWISRFDLQKAAVKIHRLYNLSSFRLGLSPIRPFQNLITCEVTAWCQAGICITYNFVSANRALDVRHMQLLDLFLKSDTTAGYSANRFDSYVKKHFANHASEILAHHGELFLDWKNYIINYQHWPLETIFLSPNVSAKKK